ncbi:MAG: DMT family transporter [Rhodospirillaceae bacterium]|jgi:drug/metabolite transporter (DMT)-like permease|nr:DMT family transporter [Rhodospirillaceae bacterium]
MRPHALRARFDGLPGNLRGALWILLTAFVMTMQSAIVKELGGELHTLVIVFFRCFFALLILLPVFLRRGPAMIRTRRPWMHVARSVVGIASMSCMFFALAYLPLADVTALVFTMPLFMIVFAVLLLGETIRWRRWSATAVGFCGVLVVLQPGAGFEWASLVALTSACLSAMVGVLIKKLSVTDSASTMVFYFAFIGLLVSGVPALFVWHTPNGAELLLLFVIALLGTLGQIFAVYAWEAGEATAVAPFDYTRLIFAAIMGYVLFADIPELATVGGAVLIVASTLYIARREARLRTGRPNAAAPTGPGQA